LGREEKAMPFEIVTLGETMVMVTPTRPESLESATAFSLEVGGAESNFALYLQELGHTTTWASRVGDDPLGRRILRTITGHGVDTSFVTIDTDAPTGLYVKDPGAVSTAVYYYRRGSAASRMDADLVATLPLAEARLVHLTGITPGLSDSCARLADALVAAVAGTNAELSFDVNYRPGVWAASAASPILQGLANRCDIVLVGLDEAVTLWGTETPEDVRKLLPHPTRLVVKDGAVGATEFRRDGAGQASDVRTFVPTPPVEVVEVVGAGDAFAAGYLHAVIGDLSPEASLAEGHRLAARALGTMGDYLREVLDDG
jgi:2-dehydro-3-deoxygluconokinase